jgi:hypothetical protein
LDFGASSGFFCLLLTELAFSLALCFGLVLTGSSWKSPLKCSSSDELMAAAHLAFWEGLIHQQPAIIFVRTAPDLLSTSPGQSAGSILLNGSYT